MTILGLAVIFTSVESLENGLLLDIRDDFSNFIGNFAVKYSSLSKEELFKRY